MRPPRGTIRKSEDDHNSNGGLCHKTHLRTCNYKRYAHSRIIILAENNKWNTFVARRGASLNYPFSFPIKGFYVFFVFFYIILKIETVLRL